MPRADDLTLIADHFDSLHHYADRVVIQTVIEKLGLANVFTDEALAEIADTFAWNAADRERRTEENRAALRKAAGPSPLELSQIAPRAASRQSEAA